MSESPTDESIQVWRDETYLLATHLPDTEPAQHEFYMVGSMTDDQVCAHIAAGCRPVTVSEAIALLSNQQAEPTSVQTKTTRNHKQPSGLENLRYGLTLAPPPSGECTCSLQLLEM